MAAKKADKKTKKAENEVLKHVEKTKETKKKKARASGQPVEDDIVDPDLKEGLPPDETDNANYFCEYAYLYHQMDMLEDSHRTGSYFNAVISNPGCFEGKVVLDVGAGTCILSMFAARAGAKTVFAVEATDMAERGRRIVEANGLGDVVKVLQGTVETVSLPCQVDIIISEWMGYFLLRESMLDSVLHARDKFLKPGGALFPSHATLLLAPIGLCKTLSEKYTTWEGEKQHWANFSDEMSSSYEMDFGCVREEFMREQRKYYLQTGIFVNLTPKFLAGAAAPLWNMDLAKISLEDLKSPSEPVVCTMRVTRDGDLEGFAGFFDTPFRGSRAHPVDHEVTLTTAPTNGTTTHWGQQIFGFFPAMKGRRGDNLEITMFIRRQKKNHRLLWLETSIELYMMKDGQKVVKDSRKEEYYVD